MLGPGVKVICVRGGRGVTKGNIYTVDELYIDHDPENGRLRQFAKIAELGERNSFYADRFKLLVMSNDERLRLRKEKVNGAKT